MPGSPHPLSPAGLVRRELSAMVVGLALGVGSLVRLFIRDRASLPSWISEPGRPRRIPFDSTLGPLVDAVIPADPDGGPGAREAGALEVLGVASLEGPLRVPIAVYLAALALATDAAALATSGRPFRRLGAEERSRLFGRLLRWLPGLYVPVLLASGLAFAGGVVSTRGLEWLGLPGDVDRLAPGEGAVDFEPRSRTADGNLP